MHEWIAAIAFCAAASNAVSRDSNHTPLFLLLLRCETARVCCSFTCVSMQSFI
jgi:hypothetical protein